MTCGPFYWNMKGLIPFPERVVSGKWHHILPLPCIFLRKASSSYIWRVILTFWRTMLFQSTMVPLPLACCLCQRTTADSSRRSGQCSLSSHSARAAPGGEGWFLPPLTLCRDCLLLNPGAFPCAMLSGSKTVSSLSLDTSDYHSCTRLYITPLHTCWHLTW